MRSNAPRIADIATLSARIVSVPGKQPGRTTVTRPGLDGRPIANVEVQVTPDLAELKERLRELRPDEPIVRARSSAGGALCR